MFDTLKTKLLIPAGKCPIELVGTSSDEVLSWISKLSVCSKPHIEYQVSVYRYWAQCFYKHGSKDLAEVNTNISKILGTSETLSDLMESKNEER